MNRAIRWVGAALVAGAVLAGCQTEPYQPPTELAKAVESCFGSDAVVGLLDVSEDGYTATITEATSPEAINDETNNGDLISIEYVYCIQDKLDAPNEDHILHPSDIDVRTVYSWDDNFGNGHTATVTPIDEVSFDVVFRQSR